MNVSWMLESKRRIILELKQVHGTEVHQVHWGSLWESKSSLRLTQFPIEYGGTDTKQIFFRTLSQDRLLYTSLQAPSEEPFKTERDFLFDKRAREGSKLTFTYLGVNRRPPLVGIFTSVGTHIVSVLYISWIQDPLLWPHDLVGRK